MVPAIDFQRIQQRLLDQVPHPTALAAAINEILDCQRHQSCLIAVLDRFPANHPHEDALFEHAIERAELWLEFLEVRMTIR